MSGLRHVKAHPRTTLPQRQRRTDEEPGNGKRAPIALGLVLAFLGLVATAAVDGAATQRLDKDFDGVPDEIDNCVTFTNADQRDTDNDGHGNRCDADLNNDCLVNPIDLGRFRSVFFSTNADADLDGNGVVDPVDLAIFRSFFFQPPGYSGVGALGCPPGP